MNNTYLMRSLMFVPAHNQKLLDSAVRRDADVLLLDIEDSVPFAEKQLSRDNIKNFVKRPDLHGKLLFPRVNDRESGELLRDAYQLTIDGIAGFMYPKATKGEPGAFHYPLRPLSCCRVTAIRNCSLSALFGDRTKIIRFCPPCSMFL